jgi:hypothetical protein
MMGVLAVGIAVERRSLHGQQIAGDRHGHVLVRDTWKLEIQDEVVLGLMHVEDRRRGPYRRP